MCALCVPALCTVNVANVYCDLGGVLRACGETEAAAAALMKAEEVYTKLGEAHNAAYTQSALDEVLQSCGRGGYVVGTTRVTLRKSR